MIAQMREWSSAMSIELFENLAAEYDRWFEESPDLYRQELALVRRTLPAVRGRALEVGCGTGRFAVPLSIGTCVEPARAMARMARERGIDVLRACAEALPFVDNSFDLVLMVTVVCYLKDPEAAFAEVRRVLSRGGRFVNAFLERGGEVAAGCIRNPGKSVFLSKARFYSTEEMIFMLKGQGLAVRDAQALPSGFSIITASRPHQGEK